MTETIEQRVKALAKVYKKMERSKVPLEAIVKELHTYLNDIDMDIYKLRSLSSAEFIHYECEMYKHIKEKYLGGKYNAITNTKKGRERK
jgi:hypothetical protein